MIAERRVEPPTPEEAERRRLAIAEVNERLRVRVEAEAVRERALWARAKQPSLEALTAFAWDIYLHGSGGDDGEIIEKARQMFELPEEL